MPTVDTVRTVETPEGVLLRLRPAGPLPRAAAYLVDLLLIYMGLMAAAMALLPLGGAGVGTLGVLSFLALWLYPVLFEVLAQGRTPGKRVFHLRVLMTDGLPLAWSASMVRNLLRVVDGLPFSYTVGFLAMLCTRQHQRVGDLVADTVVVHDPPRRVAVALPEADPVALPAPLTPAEQAALVAFAERSPLMSAARVEELADLLEGLTGATGPEGVRRLHGMARAILGTGGTQ